jgi:CRISPR system Cascade subunit CasA
MTRFNLIDFPWLPVRDHEGSPRLISLLELFGSPEGWADLDLRAYERVSVLRLLVCITQAALGAPIDSDGWSNFGGNLSALTTAYLSKWRSAFDLFGDGPRFIQRRPAEAGEPTLVSKLIPHLASGNNPKNFDHGGGTVRPLPPATLALALLSFQNFYPLYGAGYKGRGPCVDGNMLHTFLRGANLRELILNNCIDRCIIEESLGGMGRPLWEQFPSSPADKPATDNARLTYLGRLVPLHRTLWLCDDCAHALVGQDGWEYPRFEAYREPSATVITVKDKPRQLWASLERSIWRDLHALTVLARGTNSTAGAPFIVQSHFDPALTAPVDIWTGALVTDGKAKILDTVESVFRLPARLFDAAGRGIYERGVAYAQMRAGNLRDAVKVYGAAMKNESPPTASAERYYWHSLDQNSAILIELAGDASLGDLHFGGPSADRWTQLVRRALMAAFERSCPRNTPRQIEAFA